MLKSLFASLVLMSLLAPSSYAEPLCPQTFLAKTASSSERVRAVIGTNGLRKNGDGPFITTRSWEVFRQTLLRNSALGLSAGKVDVATKIFSRLTENDVILDAGSGDAYLSDILFGGIADGPYQGRPATSLPHYTGVTFALNKRPAEFFTERLRSGRFSLVTGKYFEDVQRAEIVPPGKTVKVIADYYGILSYTDRPDLILKKYFEILDKDGVLIVAGSPGISFAAKNGFWDLASFLKSIPGIRVEVLNNYMEPALVVTLTGAALEIPELEFVSFRDLGRLPYIRSFKPTGQILHVP